eukprot:3300826-Pyramimonas_sp.AAC.1
MATCLKKARSDHGAWEAILADFETLGNGMVSASTELRDVHGTQWQCVLMLCKGDEEVRCVEWGFPSYSSNTEVCSECLANRTNRPYTDLQ